MFRGITSINIDDKGRIALPVRYREIILQEYQDTQVVATIDTEDSCLLLYPLSNWRKLEEKIEALPSFQPASRRIQRLLIGHASEINIDGHGRIVLPAMLREYAKLEKGLVMVGQGQKFELWSQQNWQVARDLWLQEAQQQLPQELQGLSI